MKEGDIFKLEFYGEICCDDCRDIIHNHIDCPICKKKYAGTEQYHHAEAEEDIICEECGSVFELVKEEGNWDSWYSNSQAKIKKLDKII
jgi:hypothetical protein